MGKIKRLSKAEIASFCRQTALIIKAGITPAEGMNILINDTINELKEHVVRVICSMSHLRKPKCSRNMS